jgi:ParB family chromosome partitioning protein
MNTASEYRDLPLVSLAESANNPRRRFDEAALNELADSIRTQGILAPLVVRPVGQHFEIVAGARRLRAAQIAGLETAPVRIVELSDAQALEASIVENLQRRDVHPLDEAQGFAALMRLEEPQYSIEQVGAKCGKTPAYVAARLRLTELAAEVVEAFAKDEIGVGHALLLAKLQPEQQLEALNACYQEQYSNGSKAKRILLPVRHLQQWIEHNIFLELASAQFSKEDAQLVPEAGACLDCPKRTGHNTLLFEGMAALSDSCSDPKCYAAKLDANVRQTIATKPKLVQISTAYGVQKEGSAAVPRNRYVEIRQDKPTKKEQENWPEYKTC